MSPEHQAKAAVVPPKEHVCNSSLLNTSLVAIVLLDVMLHQLYQDTSNHKKEVSLYLFFPSCTSQCNVDQIIDLFTLGILEG